MKEANSRYVRTSNDDPDISRDFPRIMALIAGHVRASCNFQAK